MTDCLRNLRSWHHRSSLRLGRRHVSIGRAHLLARCVNPTFHLQCDADSAVAAVHMSVPACKYLHCNVVAADQVADTHAVVVAVSNRNLVADHSRSCSRPFKF